MPVDLVSPWKVIDFFTSSWKVLEIQAFVYGPTTFLINEMIVLYRIYSSQTCKN